MQVCYQFTQRQRVGALKAVKESRTPSLPSLIHVLGRKLMSSTKSVEGDARWYIIKHQRPGACGSKVGAAH